MERRTFVSMAAGTTMALAFEPAAFASELEAKSLVPYPDPAVEVVDPRFAKYQIISAAVERLYTGARWAEGPVWVGEGGYLLFSDIPNNRMLRWLEETGEVTVFRSPSNYSNGNCRDREGRLITCEHDTRRVTRTEHDGTVTVLMDSFQGKKLNAPNDVVVHSDGAIWLPAIWISPTACASLLTRSCFTSWIAGRRSIPTVTPATWTCRRGPR